ncbi:maleylpyruvate isomerase family mycothiol-dependent enzyme [Nocardioides caldifontis]|uniref:maleylpyruvate isomerase family mycothiol-dependent enzyme n=1 Tax=Nocardioides caldifontis TaxID=2588938 RepID=UPI0011DF091E|nr:maleylpyruvate isomerase family mycothiol-dependent enzyme [Nocardioides caldifontis]
MTSTHDPLRHLVDVWHRAAQDAVALLRALEPHEWELPTDLPGWDVRAVASHLAHLESELAGNPQEQVEVPEAPHVKGLMGQFTEAGCVVRRGWPAAKIVEELESSVAARYAALQADPPTDPSAPGPGFAGLIGWSWQTLLSNRPLDLWMHEQDIRRATGRPGGMTSPAAEHVADVFARSLPYVLGKKVGAPVGTTVVLEVTGPVTRTLAATVGDDGRGAALAEPPGTPDARVLLGFEDYAVLAGGRRPADAVDAKLEGDEALARRVLASLAVTP